MSIHGRLEIDQANRGQLGAWTTVRDTRFQPCDLMIEDLSATGCRIVVNMDIPIGTVIDILIPRIGKHSARVMFGGRPAYDCAFLAELSDDALRDAVDRGPRRVTPGPQVQPVAEVVKRRLPPSPDESGRRIPLWIDVAVLGFIAPFAMYVWTLMHR